MINDQIQNGEIIIIEGKATLAFFLLLDALIREINDKKSNTTDLEDAGSKINTQGKVAGKMIENEDTGAAVFSSGTLPGDIWRYFDESVAHTPV